MVGIGEANLIVVDHRSVGTVEPNYRLIAGVNMVVPAPVGCRDEVAFLHRQWFSFDNRCGASALYHEANGFHGVAMSRGKFARTNHLRAHQERMGCSQF